LYSLWRDLHEVRCLSLKNPLVLNPELAIKLRFADPGDVILVSTGETISDIGQSVAWLGNEPVVIHDALYAFKSKMDPRFVSYYFRTRQFRDQLVKHISTSKVSAISTDRLGWTTIPVPPIAVQQKVADILDNFTLLELELQEELATRRVQYEFYRERLMDFKEL